VSEVSIGKLISLSVDWLQLLLVTPPVFTPGVFSTLRAALESLL